MRELDKAADEYFAKSYKSETKPCPRDIYMAGAEAALALLCEEVGKVENPYRSQKSLAPDIILRLHAYVRGVSHSNPRPATRRQ